MIPVTIILSKLKGLLTNKWFWLGVLIIAVVFLGLKLKKTIEENKRLSRNYEIMSNDFGKEKDKSGELRVTVGELGDIISKDSILIAHLYDSLHLKDSQIEQVTQLKQETKIDTIVKWNTKKVIVKDSLGIESVKESKCLEFKDKWVDISACQLPESDNVQLNIEIIDDITIVAYKYKDVKWFLPRLWKPWKYETAVENSNPYNKINITKNIKIIKR